jgi:branched-chain amino acid transport system substrate-binding protein
MKAKFFVLMLVFAFSLDSSAKMMGKWVKLGGISTLTGATIEWGNNSKWAAEIAVEEINAKGGIGGVPIKLTIYDSARKPDQGIAMARKLIDRDKVLAILGPCTSGVYKAVVPVVDREKIVDISNCSSAPGLAKGSIWAFRNTLTADKQLGPAIKAWVEKYKPRTVVTIYNAGDAMQVAEGKSIIPKGLEKLGVKVLDYVTYKEGDIDFTAQVTRAKSFNPDGVVLGSCYNEGGMIVKEMTKQGLNLPVLGGSCLATDDFIRIGGKGTKGAIVTSAAWTDDPRPEVQGFIKKYKEKSGGKLPNYGGMRNYDNVYIMKMVMEKYGVTNDPAQLAEDRDKIRKGLAELKNFDGICGKTTLDAEGEGAGGSTVLIVEKGKLVRVAY